MVTVLRFILFTAFAVLTLIPSSPLFGKFLVAVPCFFAFIAVLEFAYVKWSGADLLQRTKRQYAEGDLRDAANGFDALLRLDRQAWVGSRAAALAAAVEIERGLFAEASMHSRLSRELLDNRESKATHLALEGLINHLLGQPREALSRLESAQALQPPKPLHGAIALVRATVYLFHEQNERKALRYLDRAAASPGHPMVARQLGLWTALALAEAERREEARTLLLDVPRDLPMRSFVEARILHLGGDLLHAVSGYESTMERLDDAYLLYRSVTRYHLGTARMELGQIRDGSKALHEALKSNLPSPYRRTIPHLIEQDAAP